MNAIEWCRDQQLKALEHLADGHRCNDVRCSRENNLLWLNDAFSEEMELEYTYMAKPIADEVRKRQEADEDAELKRAINRDLSSRLAGYELWSDATIMPDRRTGRLHVCLNFSITYEQARKL